MSSTIFTEEGWSDYLYWQEQDRKTLRKINKLLQSISRDGALNGEGKPEKLKHIEERYSRRIDSTNRLVYKVEDNKITVITCRGHYDEQILISSFAKQDIYILMTVLKGELLKDGKQMKKSNYSSFFPK